MVDPIQGRYRRQLNLMAEAIDAELNGRSHPKRVAFVLLIAEFGAIEDGRVNFISNGDRADMIAMVREWLARSEGRYSDQAGQS